MLFKFNSERTKKIFDLSLPIIIGMVSQNTLNLVDTAMVGRLGATSLAAVGISGMMVFLIQSLVIGVSSGVQAIAARKKGEGKLHEIGSAINGGLIFSFVFGLSVTILSLFISKWLFALVVDNQEVRILAKDYFDIRMAVTVFAVANFAFRGFWTAIDASKTYMMALIVMHIANIILNYALIFGNWGFPAMGVKGSSLATSISVVLGTVIYFWSMFRKSKKLNLNFKTPTFLEIKVLSQISMISGFETMVTMSNIVAQYWLIGKIGITELAAINILMNIMLVVLLPAIGFGISLATLAGQALGRGDLDDSYNWGLDVAKLGFLCFIVVSLPMAIMPEAVIRIFTDDPGVIHTAAPILRIMGFTMPLEMVGFIFMDAFKGVGDSKTALKVSFIMQWIYFSPIALILVFVFHWGLLSVWLAQTSYHTLQSLWLFITWKQRKWQK